MFTTLFPFVSLSLHLCLSLSALPSPLYLFFIICISHQSCCTPGVIKTALPNMDREVKEQYQVLIQAKDMGGQLGGLAGTTTINITLSDVNDNPPRFSKSECTLQKTTSWLLCRAMMMEMTLYRFTHFFDNEINTVQLQRGRGYSSYLLFVIAFHYLSLCTVVSNGLFVLHDCIYCYYSWQINRGWFYFAHGASFYIWIRFEHVADASGIEPVYLNSVFYSVFYISC